MFRLREVRYKMFIVEILIYKWTFRGLKKEWKPYIKVSGMNEVWHHSSYDFAMLNLLDQIKRDVIMDFIN